MTVQLERNGAVSTITLNRPEAMNAANAALRDELLEAVEQAAADPHTRAVILTGAGKAFCSGADLKSGFEPAEDGMPDVGTALRDHFHPIIRGLRTMPKPVITAVNGPAVGIGISFALAGDLILAAESSYFMLAFVNIGLVPDGGSSFLIPERIGFARATEMAMLGERVPARQALEWGLINRVVEDSALKANAEAPWLITFTVLTTSASDDLGHLHDRTPMMLTGDEVDAWLDPRPMSVDERLGLLVPAVPGRLDAWPVSTEVNNHRNNGPQLIEPVPPE